MKIQRSIQRITLYIRGLFLQRFTKDVMQYLGIALVFVISVATWTLAIKLSLLMSSPAFIIPLLSIVCGISLLLSVSKSFQAFHNRKTSALMIAWPASSLEKYCAILVFYFFTHVVVVTVIITCAQILVCLLSELILGPRHVFGSWLSINAEIIGGDKASNLLDIIFNSTKFIKTMGILSCYFFAAAVFFRKNQFIKAGLIVWLFYVLRAIAAFIVEIVELSKVYGKNSPHFLEYSTQIPYDEKALFIGGVFCIIIGYFRFSRIQYR